MRMKSKLNIAGCRLQGFPDMTHTEVGIVALRRFATRTASQRLWRGDKSRSNAVPTLNGSGLSQRDNRYLPPSAQSLRLYASALQVCSCDALRDDSTCNFQPATLAVTEGARPRAQRLAPSRLAGRCGNHSLRRALLWPGTATLRSCKTRLVAIRPSTINPQPSTFLPRR